MTINLFNELYLMQFKTSDFSSYETSSFTLCDFRSGHNSLLIPRFPAASFLSPYPTQRRLRIRPTKYVIPLYTTPYTKNHIIYQFNLLNNKHHKSSNLGIVRVFKEATLVLATKRENLTLSLFF